MSTKRIVAGKGGGIQLAAPEGARRNPDGFKFKGDYSLSVAEMVALGRYEGRSEEVTQDSFPHDRTIGEIEVTAELVRFPERKVSMDVALAELDFCGLRPATMAELLAFGATFPEAQRWYPIVELGSIGPGRFCREGVGQLDIIWDYDVSRSLRRILVHSIDGVWFDFCRFLAIRK